MNYELMYIKDHVQNKLRKFPTCNERWGYARTLQGETFRIKT